MNTPPRQGSSKFLFAADPNATERGHAYSSGPHWQPQAGRGSTSEQNNTGVPIYIIACGARASNILDEHSEPIDVMYKVRVYPADNAHGTIEGGHTWYPGVLTPCKEHNMYALSVRILKEDRFKDPHPLLGRGERLKIKIIPAERDFWKGLRETTKRMMNKERRWVALKNWSAERYSVTVDCCLPIEGGFVTSGTKVYVHVDSKVEDGGREPRCSVCN